MTTAPPKRLSRDVHRMLREAWAAPLKSSGWKRSTLSPTAWSHTADGDSVSFWVQIDKYGWWDGFGSELTVEFQYDAGPASDQPGALELRRRFVHFLPDDAIRAMLEANARVRDSLPPDPPVAVPGFDPYPHDLERRTWSPTQAHGVDIWLRYHDDTHIRWIAGFLLPHFDAIARTMRTRHRAR